MMRSAKCLRRQSVVLAIVASLLAGCATGVSDGRGVRACPPVVDYGAELQARAAAEVEMLPASSPLAGMLSDYVVMRDQARVCSGHANR
jgi:hypothetical protein